MDVGADTYNPRNGKAETSRKKERKKKELKGNFLSMTYSRRENSQMQQTKSAEEERLSLGVRKSLHTTASTQKGPFAKQGVDLGI